MRICSCCAAALEVVAVSVSMDTNELRLVPAVLFIPIVLAATADVGAATAIAVEVIVAVVVVVVVNAVVVFVPTAAAAAADDVVAPPAAERRPFLRGGWSSDEAPVAAAFLLFLSILSLF